MKIQTLEKLMKVEYLKPKLVEKLLIKKDSYQRRVELINELLKKKEEGRDK